jgi:hypothetical protein
MITFVGLLWYWENSDAWSEPVDVLAPLRLDARDDSCLLLDRKIENAISTLAAWVPRFWNSGLSAP